MTLKMLERRLSLLFTFIAQKYIHLSQFLYTMILYEWGFWNVESTWMDVMKLERDGEVSKLWDKLRKTPSTSLKGIYTALFKVGFCQGFANESVLKLVMYLGQHRLWAV